MSNVRTLNKEAITPEVILESAASQLPEIRALYIVGIRHDGKPQLWASGLMPDMALASLALQDLAMDFMNNRVIQERDIDK